MSGPNPGSPDARWRQAREDVERDDAVHPERLEQAADDLSEAVEHASESRHHLERVADRLEELVRVWKTPPSRPPSRISGSNLSD